MEKADPALVEEVLAAARKVIGDPEVRAKLVPDAIDDVDPAHLRLRLQLFESMEKMQRALLQAHTLKASKGTPGSGTAAAVAQAKAAAERLTPDPAQVDALIAVAGNLADEALDQLAGEIGKIADAQRKDLEILLAMDDRAEARAARAAQAAATPAADRTARLQQMKADLEEKKKALEARLAALRDPT